MAGLGWAHQMPVLMGAAECLAQAAKPAQEVNDAQQVPESKSPAGQHVCHHSSESLALHKG